MDGFYENKHDPVFRFGDVIKGFASSTPIIEHPLLTYDSLKYNIEVSTSHFSVVLSPCCSIDDGILTLAPLQKILPSFYQNPWLVEDFTRINRKMPAEKSVPPHKWASLSQEIKEKEFDLEKDGYAFDDFFIYAEHPSLPKYTVNLPRMENQLTGFYRLDFKTVYRINCDQIKRDKRQPTEAKLLQLSITSRSDLRNKISDYFARVPVEDQV